MTWKRPRRYRLNAGMRARVSDALRDWVATLDTLIRQQLARLFPRWAEAGRASTPMRRNALLELASWLALAVGFTALVFAALVFYYSVTVPDPRIAGITRAPANLTILASDGSFIAERGMRRGYVQYDDLPPQLVNAVIAVEDRRFRYHLGFDPIGMARAAWRNWQADGIVEGGSTITQQLAKVMFLRPNRTWTRKIEEIILSIWLEVRFTKDEIVELYLNRVYFAAGNYGIGAAAYHYFGKEARDLALAECALLAGLIKAPSEYSPLHNLTRARDRARSVLMLMAEEGMIGLEEHGVAVARPATFQTLPTTPGFEHAVDWIAELVPQLAGDVDANLIVETSLDAALQQAAVGAMEAVLTEKGAELHAGEGAVTVMAPDGRIAALIGGRNYQLSQFNRAVHGRRQPGSSFKPFIYLAALERGMTPDTVVDDTPVEIGTWRPRNHGGFYRGPIPMRRALAQSSNMVAVRLMDQIGLPRVIATARRLGITTDLRVHPTLALGTSDVNLLEMTGAYAAFANGGYGVAPQIIDRIRSENGAVLYERSRAAAPRIVPEKAVAAMNSMLRTAVEVGTGQGAALPTQLVAAKTGTSQRYRDAWFLGFTPYYVGGVWLGNDNNAPMKTVTGGSLPAQIWRRIMTVAHAELEPKQLTGVDVPPEMIRRWQAQVAGQSPFGAVPPLPARRPANNTVVPIASPVQTVAAPRVQTIDARRAIPRGTRAAGRILADRGGPVAADGIGVFSEAEKRGYYQDRRARREQAWRERERAYRGEW